MTQQEPHSKPLLADIVVVGGGSSGAVIAAVSYTHLTLPTKA